jgi:hypothetical protein
LFVTVLIWILPSLLRVEGNRQEGCALNSLVPTYPRLSLRSHQVTSYSHVCFYLSFLSILIFFFFFFVGRVPNKSADLFDYSSQLAWQVANPLNFTTSDGTFPITNTTLYNTALLLCSPLNGSSLPSSQCGAYVANTTAVYQACLADVMLSGEFSYAASNIDAYSTVCSANAQSAGVTIGNASLFPLYFYCLFPNNCCI